MTKRRKNRWISGMVPLPENNQGGVLGVPSILTFFLVTRARHALDTRSEPRPMPHASRSPECREVARGIPLPPPDTSPTPAPQWPRPFWTGTRGQGAA